MNLDKVFKIADELDRLAEQSPKDTLKALEDAANEAGKSWCGSWLGYHSRIYYKDLLPVPPGARFSKEWGFMEVFANEGTHGEWCEVDFDKLVEHIRSSAGVEDISLLNKQAKVVEDAFEEHQSSLLSLLTPIHDKYESDKFLEELFESLKKEKVHPYGDYVKFFQPSGQQMSRDMNAIQAGLQLPPHFSVLAEMGAIKNAYSSCKNLAKLARRAGSHLENIESKETESRRIGTNVFIGHGRSSAWRDLKDFIQDRMHLPWDEFNRIPVAGVTNIARLSQMLDTAAVAFIIMTAEDEQADGKAHARMNVIHEVGLFQGRLGFERAIVLLEEGCEEFSNIQGLGQIRFPTGNISAKFEEIRQVLEREGLVE
ncbi:MAG: hypothetical protein SynsKO_29840 [Synoicihabitans sp.]